MNKLPNPTQVATKTQYLVDDAETLFYASLWHLVPDYTSGNRLAWCGKQCNDDALGGDKAVPGVQCSECVRILLEQFRMWQRALGE